MIALSMRLAIIRALRHVLAVSLYAGVVKLVDTSDSKSDALKSVPVRVRPPVPLKGI
jgi:hypothetical protein